MRRPRARRETEQVTPQATERPAGPRSGAPAGSLTLRDGFSTRHPAFLDTSETSSYPWRLDLRHEAVFTMNRELFAGARVLDIASHDGRWTLAALEAGAAHVTGIEARPELVANAERTLAAAGADPAAYRLVAGDVFEVLARPEEYDLVLCLGFLYHTLRHLELLGRIRQTGARHVIIDTEVHRAAEPVVRIATERIERQGNAVADLYTVDSTVVTGRPTLAALNLMLESQGYAVERLSDWDGLLRDNPDATQVRDYRIGRRLTATYRRAPRSARMQPDAATTTFVE